MLAMIFSSPPQRVQLSISTPNTRLNHMEVHIQVQRRAETLHEGDRAQARIEAADRLDFDTYLARYLGD